VSICAIISVGEDGYDSALVSWQELEVQVDIRSGLTKEELAKTSPDFIVAIPPVTARELAFAGNQEFSFAELSRLLSAFAGKEANEKLPTEDYLFAINDRSTFSPLTVSVAETKKTPPALLLPLYTLLKLLARLLPLPLSLRYRLAIIADECSLPYSLFTSWEEEYSALALEEQFPPEEIVQILREAHSQKSPATADSMPALKDIDQIFREIEAGRFNQLDFEFRKEQWDFSLEIESAIKDELHLIIEAGTGIGKSIGYLLPGIRKAFQENEPVIVSTYTKILQEQILLSDFPRACALLERQIPAPVVLKGRENYLCLEKLRLRMLSGRDEIRELLSETMSRSGRERLAVREKRALGIALVALIISSLSRRIGDFEHLVFARDSSETVASAIRDEFNCAFRGCLRETCPLLRECFFYSQRELAERSLLTIVNHALLFSLYHPLADETDAIANFIDKSHYFILDEAHNLEDAILSSLLTDINSFELISFINNVQRLVENKKLQARLLLNEEDVPLEDREHFRRIQEFCVLAPSFTEKIYRIYQEWLKLAKQAYETLSQEEDILALTILEEPTEETREIQQNLLRITEDFLASLQGIESYLLVLAERTARASPSPFLEIDDNRYQIALREVVNHFAELKESAYRFLVEQSAIARWLEVKPIRERDEYFFSLNACPVIVGDAFKDFLLAKKSVCMVSGTLSIHGNFQYFKSALNIDAGLEEKLYERIIKSPFDYAGRTLLLISKDVPEPDFENKQEYAKYLESLAQGIAEVVKCFGGNTLVLFNSYSDLERVAEICEEALMSEGLTLLRQFRGVSKVQLSYDFRRIDGAVLFGTRSFWEGFDVKGEDLQCVVITRLPFPNIKEPLTSGKIRYLESVRRNSFTQFILPSAILKFTQGFGRLMRSKDDFGVVLIMDKRVLTKRYGKSFLENLPSPKVTEVNTADIYKVTTDFLARIKDLSRRVNQTSATSANLPREDKCE